MTIRPRRSSRGGAQAGFTLVEALVALVVLAIGLLGIAALYLDSLRAGRTALNRTVAVQMAADLADRIRANRAAGLAYDLGIDAETPVPEGACDSLAACDAVGVALADLAEWRADLSSLANGTGSVTVTPGEPTAYVITVQWTEPGQEDPVTYVLRVEV